MITGDLRTKIDSLWLAFHSGGMTEGLTVISHISYLMFMHDLDLNDQKRAKDALFLRQPYKSIFDGEFTIYGRTFNCNDLRWSVFKDFPAEKQFDIVTQGAFNFIKNVHADKNSAFSRYMNDAVFSIPTPSKLAQVISKLEDIYETSSHVKETDVKGDIYEYLLSKLSQQGTNGQFRTPRHIIKMMVEMMDPTSKDLVCDPACGTAGFLLASAEHVYDKMLVEAKSAAGGSFEPFDSTRFIGYDTDSVMLRIGAMNMMSHGIELPDIRYMDSVSKNNPDVEKYSLVLANPPFTGSIEESEVAPSVYELAPTKKSELLFVSLFVRILKVGGRCASIVPDGVLFGSSKAHVNLRKHLVEKQKLEAVISMPSGVFMPYAGVSTAILVFTKTNRGGTDNVWFYDMKTDGYSLDAKRAKIDESDIPDIIERYHNRDKELSRARTEQSFMVPVKEIISKGYDLSFNKYKDIVYEEVKYPPSKDIVDEMIRLNDELAVELKKLREMLQ